MNDNKRLISINLKFEYIYFILFIGVYFLPKKYKKFNEYNNNESIQFIAHFCIIIFYIIETYLSKKNIKESSNDKKITLSQNFYNLIENNEKNSFVTIKLILCSIIFEFIANYSFHKISINNFKYFIDFISLFIIQKFIFKEKYYSHQYIVMIFHLLSIIIILLVNPEFGYINIYRLIFIILNQYCFCFSLSLLKTINTTYFINIYLLGSIIGFSRFLFFFINVKFIKNTKIQIPNFGNIYLYIYFIIRLTYYYLYYTFLMKYKIFIIILCQCFYASIDIILILSLNLYIKILLSIFFLIPLFIFIEIIELHFCGLSDNLKYIIEERAKYEDERMRPSFLSSEFIEKINIT